MPTVPRGGPTRRPYDLALTSEDIAGDEILVRAIEVTLQERRAALAVEESDVERLEHLSWTRIVAGLRGRHASELERETAERDAARYAVREARLVAVSERLGSAESWSAWDTFMGGGLITDVIEHSRVDDVRAQLREADLGRIQDAQRSVQETAREVRRVVDGLLTAAA